jgi:uncharacterized protein YjiS (DUF1127 family)
MSFGTAVAELRHYAAPARPGHRLLSVLLRFEAWRDARESRRSLYRLDDRALADIGLSRSALELPDPAASWQNLMLPEARR